MALPEPITVEDETTGDNKLINEEYKIWKKNTPFLYDTVITHALTWPSLTCQWLPDHESPKDADHTVHRMILGTHTSDKSQDKLLIAEVLLPKPGSGSAKEGKEASELYDEEKQELGSYSKSPARIRVIHTINHDCEINRARYMPQNPDLIATKTIQGDVYIFDRTKHETKEAMGGPCTPDIKLSGLTKEGYGLSWSKVQSGHIVSSGEDDFVAYWDINGYSKSSDTIQALRKYVGHIGLINDVDWHAHHGHIFGSVGDDKQLMLWDTRVESVKPTSRITAHEAEINALAFAPSSEHIVLTGSADNTIALWDIRKLFHKTHSFESHTGSILSLTWSPHSPAYFASASEDRRVHIWDLTAIGAEQTPDDAEDGPPELMFVHGGHTSKVSDLSWNPSAIAPWHLASTAEDNVLQVWEPSRHLRDVDDDDVESIDLE